MKKLIVFILLSIFSFNFAGFAVMFFVEQRVIYFEMNEKIKEEQNLETISLTKEEAKLYLIEDEEELNINGKMYDIARHEDHGDKIIFYCINDEKEEHLFAKLESFFDYKAKNTDGKMELQLVKFLSLVTLIPAAQQHTKTEILLTSIKDISQKFASIKLTPDTLPPRQA
ncbi:MAG: hypothetical protein JST55_11335 [Bacteroidetes bacterium]|nr:hypothetical protein [Bacteroidota bacterium]